MKNKLIYIKNFGKIWVESQREVWRINTLWGKEPETIAWIQTFKDKSIFWDIGANIGLYSLFCAHRYPNTVIHAFEPHKINWRRLGKNITENDYINVTPYYAAMGRDNKLVQFCPGNLEVGSSGGQASHLAKNGSYPVWMITGNNMVLRAHSYPNYVKIDTDGNEYDVLMGMAGVLPDDRLKSILVEVNNNKSQIIELMTAAGLQLDETLMAYINRESDHNMIFTRP